MRYIEIHCKIDNSQEGNEIMIALLADLGCDSFVENEEGVLAYIPQKDFRKEIFDDLLVNNAVPYSFTLNYQLMEDKDWNAEWEANYSSVIIDNCCLIRAPFHESVPNMLYEIIIEPKMAFGTAHHSTTSQIISYLLEENCNAKKILDMGTGTGVLAILAALKGAKHITAIDNDEWAYNNCIENVEKNNIHIIETILGDAKSIKDVDYDIVIANINRNILLQDMAIYAKVMANNGVLFLSGFYKDPDLDILLQEAKKYQLEITSYKEKNGWVATRLEKRINK